MSTDVERAEVLRRSLALLIFDAGRRTDWATFDASLDVVQINKEKDPKRVLGTFALRAYRAIRVSTVCGGFTFNTVDFADEANYAVQDRDPALGLVARVLDPDLKGAAGDNALRTSLEKSLDQANAAPLLEAAAQKGYPPDWLSGAIGETLRGTPPASTAGDFDTYGYARLWRGADAQVSPLKTALFVMNANTADQVYAAWTYARAVTLVEDIKDPRKYVGDCTSLTQIARASSAQGRVTIVGEMATAAGLKKPDVAIVFGTDDAELARIITKLDAAARQQVMSWSSELVSTIPSPLVSADVSTYKEAIERQADKLNTGVVAFIKPFVVWAFTAPPANSDRFVAEASLDVGNRSAPAQIALVEINAFATGVRNLDHALVPTTFHAPPQYLYDKAPEHYSTDSNQLVQRALGLWISNGGRVLPAELASPAVLRSLHPDKWQDLPGASAAKEAAAAQALRDALFKENMTFIKKETLREAPSIPVKSNSSGGFFGGGSGTSATTIEGVLKEYAAVNKQLTPWQFYTFVRSYHDVLETYVFRVAHNAPRGTHLPPVDAATPAAETPPAPPSTTSPPPAEAKRPCFNEWLQEDSPEKALQSFVGQLQRFATGSDGAPAEKKRATAFADYLTKTPMLRSFGPGTALVSSSDAFNALQKNMRLEAKRIGPTTATAKALNLALSHFEEVPQIASFASKPNPLESPKDGKDTYAFHKRLLEQLRDNLDSEVARFTTLPQPQTQARLVALRAAVVSVLERTEWMVANDELQSIKALVLRTLSVRLEEPKPGPLISDAWVTQPNNRVVEALIVAIEAAQPEILHRHQNSGVMVVHDILRDATTAGGAPRPAIDPAYSELARRVRARGHAPRTVEELLYVLYEIGLGNKRLYELVLRPTTIVAGVVRPARTRSGIQEQDHWQPVKKNVFVQRVVLEFAPVP